MEGFDMLTKWDTVEAPPGFERRVLAELAHRKQRRIRARKMRLVFAGAGVPVAALAFFLVTGLSRPNPGRRASIRADESTQLVSPRGAGLRGVPVIPITEAVSYNQEVQKRHRNPRTIYILEQVSHNTDTEIMF